MKIILPILIALVTFASGDPEVSVETIVRFSDSVNGHNIEVSVHQGKYDFSKHKLTFRIDGSDERPKVDGMAWGGLDGTSPFSAESPDKTIETISEISLKWDGISIPVPKSLHINLLNLTLRCNPAWKTIQFVPRPSGEELLIQVRGGDGGGSYMASLVLRKNGEHTQYPPIYWESGLPDFPYVITRYLTGNGQQDSAVEEIDWLDTKKQKSEQATPR